MTAWMNSEGHRKNILRPEWRLLGTGYAFDGRFHYYVQNFGRSGGLQPPLIPAAAAYSVNSNTIRIVANYYDESENDPIKLEVSVGTRCIELTNSTGPEGNRTYQSDETSPDTCAEVVFHATSASGDTFRYPGALLVGNSCQNEFQSSDSASTRVSRRSLPLLPPILTRKLEVAGISQRTLPVDTVLIFLGPALMWTRRRH